jgi:aryl-alcohol dehydrogenase-like predicted oxidoreductase
VLDRDATYDALDALVDEGRVAAYGVSVETVDEALAAIARPHVATVQIILNAFRRKPLERVLPAAAEAGVGIIARVPLASGLLSGKYDEHTEFAPTDHRAFNRNGEAFDVGETFSGVPYDVGVAAAREVAALTPPGATTAQLALRWIVDQPGVSTVIPGARNADQARANAAAADLPPVDAATAEALRDVYDTRIRPHVHTRW